MPLVYRGRATVSICILRFNIPEMAVLEAYIVFFCLQKSMIGGSPLSNLKPANAFDIEYLPRPDPNPDIS